MFERFSRAARAAVVSARAVAVETSAGPIACEHLLLGLAAAGEPHLADAGLTADVLRDRIAVAPGTPEGDATALRAIGVDVDQIREQVDATLGPGSWDDAAPPPRRARGIAARVLGTSSRLTPAGRKVLELGLREAIVDDSREITATHLLRGLLRAPGDAVPVILAPDELTRLREQARRRAA